ncbi:MAG: OmpA family protein [Acidobacteria bacterium]|nr:MAG: OmpA family protein [Acidobacteriota bacterium]
MKKSRLITSILSLVLLVSLAGVTGCKKKPPVEPTQPAPPPAAEPAPEPPPPPPAPEPEPAPEPARPSLATLNAQLRLIHFDFDKSAIREDALPILDANAALMQKYPDLKVVIEGHCDERGTIEYNLALGDRRATVARSEMSARGVDSGRISTISYGEERATDPGHNESAWAMNRRASFRFGK